VAVDTLPIQRFMQRVAKMAALKQTDIRLTIAEAAELSASLAVILAHQVSVQASMPTSSVGSIDGGKLKN